MKKRLIIPPVIISMIVTCFFYLVNPPFLSCANQSGFHFNMVTINSIFAGFLYTNYSLLLGLLDNDTVQKLLGTSVIRRRNDRIFAGIVCAVISIITGVILAIVTAGNTTNSVSKAVNISGNWILTFLWAAECVFMVFGIFYFTISIREMHMLVNAAGQPKKKVKQDVIDDVKKVVKREK
ncbi:hypothetical protein [Ethanoligenens harbinense]|uniref:Uncharacterized protein n=1 Tax=Ethanoligenens harbinense (strain DSM 18485 / JCM 12961 / CGMCC 1.5033 / YUAN-3) TaxID=663278 RepID=E6U8W7_ETHHY|nr:hypothetical protein [Ethanoligenens harbinense]ADU27202.1 hypothetical protein Ethha_1668 [Ethanoligenens harbinense YUAN-3]AVQ96270.1 hypothetical protein CXQ68_08560 [Ethanoligenens harbinense YUAN-3]AYF38929.1 hypothetical protein CXP51_08430 [Ethanoligenens harbinense]AYF41681.1 hypothetical protein CN246_08580 [Ethanoligenens harbinense]QCN92512.1 hypothetical protein DRA42_08590 [Ethanoligenens harbinense]